MPKDKTIPREIVYASHRKRTIIEVYCHGCEEWKGHDSHDLNIEDKKIECYVCATKLGFSKLEVGVPVEDTNEK